MAKKQKKSRKSSRRSDMPKLFQRGSKGNYYFRRRIAGKDKWINTNTSSKEDAEKVALAYVNSEKDAESLSRTGSASIKHIAENLSRTITEEVTGGKLYSLKVEKLFHKWKELAPEYNDISKKAKKLCEGAFKRFSQWCDDAGIKYCEEVSNETSIKYSNFLWNSGITPKTFNDHIRTLSRFFVRLETAGILDTRNPFSKEVIPRKSRKEHDVAGHEALEPDICRKLIQEAADSYGEDYRDLFIIACQTGLRLKDVSLLKWEVIEDDFIEISPYKTRKSGNTSRIPITETVNKIFKERGCGNSEYILPEVAKHYQNSPDSVTDRTKRVFEKVLGKEKTVVKPGKHRKNNTAVYSFHSFRTTYMSLLAKQDVSIRDAMRIMGWESVEMIKVYERELEKARKNADERALKIVERIEEFNIEIPEPSVDDKLTPTEDALRRLVQKYSNITIGEIYGISEAAVRKWLKKFGIKREKRIESADIPEEILDDLRKSLIN